MLAPHQTNNHLQNINDKKLRKQKDGATPNP
jgi:hypothetical protein